MSDIAATNTTIGRRGAAAASWTAPDARRYLQLALAAIWLLDGVLQFQPYMFTRPFATGMLAPTAQGNPAVIADPITSVAKMISHHPVPWNAAFAVIQVLLGVGIAWRPTLKAALAASIAWSLGVWWFGEGLGGVLAGGVNLVNGAPGAVILYALLAVLLWPARESATVPATAGRPFGLRPAGAVAERPVGVPTARLLWLVLWGSFVYFTLEASSRAPQAWHDMIAGMADGEPGWLASIDRHTASLLAHQGLTASIVLAVVLVVIALGVFLPAPLTRVTLVMALVVTAFVWVVGENLGEILAGGQATDPNSGPLLALVVLAYWPLRTRVDPASAAEVTE